MKAVIINGSPRKEGWNTFEMLNSCKKGLIDNGVDVEFVNLYDLTFTGCMSCFACKLKGTQKHGLCEYPDELKPVMEKVLDADILVLGSPVYLGNISAQLNLFWERLMFANISYSSYENVELLKPKKCAMILTMGATEIQAEHMGYVKKFDYIGQQFGFMMGNNPAKMLYLFDAYQFADYSRYSVSPDRADAAHKKQHKEEHFEIDLENAYKLAVDLSK